MFEIGGEEMILCPYNRYHMVKKLRIQKHILKCKKNYPEINLATCIYNYSHRLKPEDLLQHYEICCHKIRLDGARYCEPDDFSRISSVRSERRNIRFPDINLKACLSSEPKVYSQMDHQDSQELDSSRSDLEISRSKNNRWAHCSDDAQDNDTDSDLEPLPLPKTVSKAFVCVKKGQKSDPPETSKPKGFGRGRNFVVSPSPKPQATDHLLPDLSNKKCDTVERNRSPCFFPKQDDSICSQSVRSFMFDDATTLKSVDISLDEDVIDNFILKDLDKYMLTALSELLEEFTEKKSQE